MKRLCDPFPASIWTVGMNTFKLSREFSDCYLCFYERTFYHRTGPTLLAQPVVSQITTKMWTALTIHHMKSQSMDCTQPFSLADPQVRVLSTASLCPLPVLLRGCGHKQLMQRKWPCERRHSTSPELGLSLLFLLRRGEGQSVCVDRVLVGVCMFGVGMVASLKKASHVDM